MRIRRTFRVSSCVVLALLTVACGDIHEQARVAIDAPTTSTTMHTPRTTTTISRATLERRWYAAATRRNAEAVWYMVARADAEAAEHRATSKAPPSIGPRPAPLVLNAGTCEQLVAKYFPDDTQWALMVAHRESGCTAGAVNWREGCDTSGRTNSHAVGVFQLCMPMHQPSFDAAGCNAPLDLECGIRAARILYDANGRSPWGG